MIIIAELCQNHNGDLETLVKMVNAAASAGATHVKIQNIYADDLAFRPMFETGVSLDGCEISIKRPYDAEYRRLKALELSNQQVDIFLETCLEQNVTPLTTCFSRHTINKIKRQGFDKIKIASYDCASFQMLREVVAVFDEVFVSTGATYDDEIATAADILRPVKFHMLHCVTLYPTPLEQLHLARMKFLRQFSNSVGFSDHSLRVENGVLASMAAIAMGASVVECHFTILQANETRDGPVSINPSQLCELREFSEKTKAEQAAILSERFSSWEAKTQGCAQRRLTTDELKNRDYYRGRFASPRGISVGGRDMIFNWEEIPIQ